MMGLKKSIKNVWIICLFNFCAYNIVSQTVHHNGYKEKTVVTFPRNDKRLDSLINNIQTNSPKLIYIDNDFVCVDTSPVKKIGLSKRGDAILITFSQPFREIKAPEFCMQITDFKERRRFFKGKVYTVWRTKAPYIYVGLNRDRKTYYFSETLTGDILRLTKENIDLYVSDPETRDWLNTYINENYPLRPLSLRETDTSGLENAVESSVEIATAVFRVTFELFIFFAETFIIPQQ